MRARIVFFFILFFLSSYSQAYMYGADLPMAYEIKFRKEKKKKLNTNIEKRTSFTSGP